MFTSQVELEIYNTLSEEGVCASQEDEMWLAKHIAKHLITCGLINRVGVSIPQEPKRKKIRK